MGVMSMAESKRSGYEEATFAQALEACYVLLQEWSMEDPARREKFELLKDEHPILREFEHWGWRGPIGSGLGRFGGHAIG
jgi:hypothetical protein